MSDKKLTSADVARLLQDPNEENRADAAVKVADTFASADLSDTERAIAKDIFRAMVRDAAVRVRQALSESLKENPDVPHDVARSLAKDVEDVALPVIEKSSVLTDEDLIEIVRTRGAALQQAVAGREAVSEDVADALVDTRDENVVATLVANEGADIAGGTYDKVLDAFKDSDMVKTPLVQRGELPISVAERLVTMVSERLREHIMTHHEISSGMAADLLLASRERATVSLLDGSETETTVAELVDQLQRNGRLTPTLIVRALCMGDTTFFEAALAALADIPTANAYKLVHDRGSLGMKRLFEAAGIPPQFLKVARAALEVSAEMIATGGDNREMFRQLMIERVLTAVEDEVDTENLDYLIGKLQRVERHDEDLALQNG